VSAGRPTSRGESPHPDARLRHHGGREPRSVRGRPGPLLRLPRRPSPGPHRRGCAPTGPAGHCGGPHSRLPRRSRPERVRGLLRRAGARRPLTGAGHVERHERLHLRRARLLRATPRTVRPDRSGGGQHACPHVDRGCSRTSRRHQPARLRLPANLGSLDPRGPGVEPDGLPQHPYVSRPRHRHTRRLGHRRDGEAHHRSHSRTHRCTAAVR
jgi:hypothetical protein